MGFKDTKISYYRVSNVKYTITKIHKYANTKCLQDIDIYIEIYITFTNWRSVQSFYWTLFFKISSSHYHSQLTALEGETLRSALETMMKILIKIYCVNSDFTLVSINLWGNDNLANVDVFVKVVMLEVVVVVIQYIRNLSKPEKISPQGRQF